VAAIAFSISMAYLLVSEMIGDRSRLSSRMLDTRDNGEL
jgi:hypothetical protein